MESGSVDHERGLSEAWYSRYLERKGEDRRQAVNADCSIGTSGISVPRSSGSQRTHEAPSCVPPLIYVREDKRGRKA